MSVTLAAAQSLHAIHLSLALATTTGPPLPPKTAVKPSHHLYVQLPHPHMHTSACQTQNTLLARSEGFSLLASKLPHAECSKDLCSSLGFNCLCSTARFMLHVSPLP